MILSYRSTTTSIPVEPKRYHEIYYIQRTAPQARENEEDRGEDDRYEDRSRQQTRSRLPHARSIHSSGGTGREGLGLDLLGALHQRFCVGAERRHIDTADFAE